MSLIATAIAAVAITTPASAAPNRTAPLSAEKKTFAWDVDPQTSISGSFWFTGDPTADCGTFDVGLGGTAAMDYCDQTVLHVSEAGVVDVQLPVGDENTNDWDLFVYASDSDGNAGDQIGLSEEIGGAEDVSFQAPGAGSYLVVVVPYQTVNSGTSASATFTVGLPDEEPGDE